MTPSLEPEANVIELHLSQGRRGTSYGGRHNNLSGRDEENAHPMGSIEGLNDTVGALSARIDTKADGSALSAVSVAVSTVSANLDAETSAREDADRSAREDLESLEDRVEALEEGGGYSPEVLASKQNFIGTSAPVSPVEGDIWLAPAGAVSVDVVPLASVSDLEEVREDVRARVEVETRARVISEGNIRADTATAIDSALSEARAYADRIGARGLAYKGSVTNAQLKAIKSPAVGDLYNILDSGEYAQGVNVAWDGSAWDPLSPTMDMSIYDNHLNARNNPHGVDWRQIGLNADQTAALEGGLIWATWSD